MYDIYIGDIHIRYLTISITPCVDIYYFCFKYLREMANVSSVAWMEPGTQKTINTGISAMDGDICVICGDNGTENITLVPIAFKYTGLWYISFSAPNGGGPENFFVTVLNKNF